VTTATRTHPLRTTKTQPARRDSTPLRIAKTLTGHHKPAPRTLTGVVAIWAGTKTTRGTGRLAKRAARGTGRAAVRTAQHSGRRGRELASWGVGRGVGQCTCGWRGPADQLREHHCADEHIHADSDQLNEDEEMDTMNDPSNWCKSADVLAEPGIEHPRELEPWFTEASNSFSPLHDAMEALGSYMESGEVDSSVLGHVGSAREAVQTIIDELAAAAKQCADLYSEVPDFEKAN
jgi:hypothetical protein